MALKLLQPGIQPLGQFDGLDSDVLTMKGGEVVSFTSVTTDGQPGVTTPGLDQGAYDVFDGYVNESGTLKRPAVTRRWNGVFLPATGVYSSTLGGRPLMLSDEGILGYGTLFGAVVGGTVGQQVNGPYTYTGAVLGPHTATGSGKTTCWDKPGLYAVSLDACDTNAIYRFAANQHYFDCRCSSSIHSRSSGVGTGGLLTPWAGANNAAGANTGPIVARLVEFNTNQSLVTTPNYLVAALNSPSGNVSSVGPRAFQFATIYFSPPST